MEEDKNENEINEVNYEEICSKSGVELEKILLDKRIVLKKLRYSDEIGGVYCDSTMERLSKQKTELVIRHIYLYRGTNKLTFNVEGYGEYFELRMIDHFVESLPIHTVEEKKDFKKLKGSKCKITINNVQDDTKYLFGIPIKYSGNGLLMKFEGDELIVLDINDDGVVKPFYLDGKYREIILTTENLEIIEENYLENIKAKKRHTKAEKEIINDIDTMEEMISKVNIKDFKKIYAGAMKRIPNNLKGVELLLNQWAFNKKHLYRLFNNNFSISKEIEYKLCAGDFETFRQELYKKYPGNYYILRLIENEEFIENKLHHSINDYDFNCFCRGFKAGERVSKVLEETLNNEQLNIDYSDIIAKSVVKGVIEISLDPIEFLLMSVNRSGWESCHAIYKFSQGAYSFGCYSSGIFSYMCDETSLIAFRHSGKLYDYQIEKQKISAYSKNWRQIIWIDKGLENFVSSRQYPCYNDEINKEVRELLQTQISKTTGNTNWVHSRSQDKIHYLLKDNIENIYKTTKGALHYNDMLNGYEGDLSYIKGSTAQQYSTFVGSFPVCPNCGKRLILEENLPICSECYNKKVGVV